ncbi:MAG: alpha/beta hydrolase, partial [Pollutimonas bauzanensis]
MRIRLRPALLIAACAVLAAAGGYVMLDRWQRATIFSIELGDSRWWREPPPGTEIFDITLRNADKVRAWYLPNADPGAPTVLYLHGSRWNLNGSAFRMERWAEMGFSVLAIDYRGFGESSPILPSQASATEDAGAALRELARRQPDAARRYVYGHS